MKNHNTDYLQVETDALQIFKDLKYGNAIFACALILLIVKEMMKNIKATSIELVGQVSW